MILLLLIDDLIATGGTAGCCRKANKNLNGKVAGFIFVINLFDLVVVPKTYKKRL